MKQNGNCRIILVDQYDYHQLKTEIHEVAAGRTQPEEVTIPISQLIRKKDIEFIQAEIARIDFDQFTVITAQGKTRYDRLVIALGSETEFFGIPGLGQNSFKLASVDDAIRIKNHIRDMFSEAKNETDEAERKAMLTIVVGGGGFTGVELVTELVGYVQRLCRQFQIPLNETQLVVVEAAETVLLGFDLELVAKAQQVVKEKGVKLMLKTPCISAEGENVNLKTGETVKTRTLIWTGGVRARDLVAEAGLKYGPRSRVVVNPFLETVDHLGVYVVGDNALILDPVMNMPLAPTGQLALQQGETAAVNIIAEMRGARRVRYVPKVIGQFVSLGGRSAVGWVWEFKVTGFGAWLLKRITLARYLYSIGGLKLLVTKFPTLFLG